MAVAITIHTCNDLSAESVFPCTQLQRREASEEIKYNHVKDVTSCYAAVGLFRHQLLQDNG